MRFFVIDDSESIAQMAVLLLQQAGHTVNYCLSPFQALQDVLEFRPDCILLDLIMPEMDGFEMCKKFREIPELDATKIIIVSAKSYDFDKRRAKQLGADGYIVKPIKSESFIDEITKILTKKLTLTYWGCHGTLPVPGAGTLRYGGNTSCVSLQVDNEPLIIFDAGTGIKKLSNHLMASGTKRLTAKIFITHPHWDHINALPFFVPLYIQGNEIEILGPSQGDASTRAIISTQMDDVYFPVTIREFSARVFFHDLREESLLIGAIQIDTLLLKHPGNCLGYRATFNGKKVCYITDNELYPFDSPNYDAIFEERLTRFIFETDILIIDTTYLNEEYPTKIGWGHSCTSEVIRIATQARVKSLHLFHHDPDQDDDAIDRKLAQAQRGLEQLNSTVECLCPTEGDQFVL